MDCFQRRTGGSPGMLSSVARLRVFNGEGEEVKADKRELTVNCCRLSFLLSIHRLQHLPPPPDGGGPPPSKEGGCYRTVARFPDAPNPLKREASGTAPKGAHFRGFGAPGKQSGGLFSAENGRQPRDAVERSETEGVQRRR